MRRCGSSSDKWPSLKVKHPGLPANERDTQAGAGRRTLTLAVLRGALLDLLATGDVDRTTTAVHQQLASLRAR